MASYWERDPLITQFVQMGYMDYGIMDVESDTELRLRRANVTLTEDCLQAPPFFVCSFLFSSLPQDAVRIEDGTLKPAMVSLLRPFPEPLDGDVHYRCPLAVSVTRSFAWRYDASLHPDWPPELASLLRARAESGVRAVYVLPTVALRLLRLARGWSEGRCAFLVADEGVFEASEMNVATDPSFLARETTRLPVNFALLCETTETAGGFVCCSRVRESFRVVAVSR